MASSLIKNSHHIDFYSVFDMDNVGLEQVFETLTATGLRNFLGCPAVFFEAALTEFFTNGSVREDGMVVSTIKGASKHLLSEKGIEDSISPIARYSGEDTLCQSGVL
ncbi:protein transport protein sec31-like [Dorcoceras hygrometricum]|uniref:Protein transport protein sec31-like n=1 Tax=Dorcoceras hygrometricum TaxID=472368 RepID=A0A2Z6ZUB4_9LAMI|nr:protein transport protein sec31-like [Dorcoceras hygrometricum]